MSSFSPAWAYQTSHPYPQYQGTARYPGNSVMATVGAADLNINIWLIVSLFVGTAGFYGGWLATKSLTNGITIAKDNKLGVNMLGGIIGLLLLLSIYWKLVKPN